MTVAPWQIGAAGEVTQARVREQTAQQASQAPAPPAEPSPPPPPPAAPPEETPVGIPEPKYEGLEILPDEDLAKLAEQHGLKADKRWGRKRLIQELAANGILNG